MMFAKAYRSPRSATKKGPGRSKGLSPMGRHKRLAVLEYGPWILQKGTGLPSGHAPREKNPRRGASSIGVNGIRGTKGGGR